MRLGNPSAWLCVLLLLGMVQTNNAAEQKSKDDPEKKPGTGEGASITKEQGDEILKELRQIRQLLERQPTQPALGQPAAPAVPQRVTVTIPAASQALGRSDAPVTIVEFIDYQCPFCQRHNNTTLVELKRKYVDTGVLRYVSRDLPLEFHGNAFNAARAARCAGQQGKFWELRQAIFADPSKLAPPDLTETARGVQADVAAFEACVAGKSVDAAIQEDANEAARLSINGTPSFVIGRTSNGTMGGTVLVGAQPISAFDSQIQQVLKGQ